MELEADARASREEQRQELERARREAEEALERAGEEVERARADAERERAARSELEQRLASLERAAPDGRRRRRTGSGSLPAVGSSSLPAGSGSFQAAAGARAGGRGLRGTRAGRDPPADAGAERARGRRRVRGLPAPARGHRRRATSPKRLDRSRRHSPVPLLPQRRLAVPRRDYVPLPALLRPALAADARAAGRRHLIPPHVAAVGATPPASRPGGHTCRKKGEPGGEQRRGKEPGLRELRPVRIRRYSGARGVSCRRHRRGRRDRAVSATAPERSLGRRPRGTA